MRCQVHRKKLTLAISLALVVGTTSADFSPTFELSGLDGTNGFTLNGAAADEKSGASISWAGDINGDGIDDVIVGAPQATTDALKEGKSYLVFGNSSLPNPLELSSINGPNGIVINGENVFDYAGSSVSAAGDINGDGIDDLIIGAPAASPDAAYSGATYVVFGDDQDLPNPLNLSDINGSNGFVINGIGAYDESGAAVSSAGDINGDGIDDLIIGAPYANGGAGAGYVVFGSDQGFTSPVELSSLNGINGFAITSAGVADTLGASVSAAGDINGDNLDDLLIGAVFAGTDNVFGGASYVIFGSEEAWSNTLALTSLDGSNGFVVYGASGGDELGASVNFAGDINFDGFSDLIVGAPKADPNGDASGASYLVFGSDQAWSSSLNVSELNGNNGFALNGANAGDNSGASAKFTGDINFDGFDDIAIGAPNADPNGDSAGASYVVFGSDQSWSSAINLSALNGTNGFVVNGVSAGDQSGGSLGAAGDINNDGFHDLIIGALFADPNGDSSGASYVVYGGTDENGDIIFANGFE